MYNIAEFYNELCRSFEHSWQAAGWESQDNQYVNFLLLESIISPNSSVLDVGCGQGDLYSKIKNKNVKYQGWDISDLMIEKAKSKHPKVSFLNKDFFEDSSEKFDCVVAAGAFSFKVEDQYSYIEKAIRLCVDRCNSAAAITMTSELADVKYEEPLFYYSPVKILEISLSITPYVILNTSSLPNEMVLFLYKNSL